MAEWSSVVIFVTSESRDADWTVGFGANGFGKGFHFNALHEVACC